MQLNPIHAHALRNLGDIERDRGHLENAVQLYTKALEITPEFEAALWQLASVYFESGRLSTAMVHYESYLKLNPGSVDAQCRIAHCERQTCHWSDWDSSMYRVISIVNEQLDNDETPCVEPFHSIVYPMAHGLRKAIAERRAAVHLANVENARQSPYENAVRLAPDNRLRVGYVSSQFVHHPTAHLMQSVPGLHNESDVEVFVYALSADDNSTFRSKIASESEHFTDLSRVRLASSNHPSPPVPRNIDYFISRSLRLR